MAQASERSVEFDGGVPAGTAASLSAFVPRLAVELAGEGPSHTSVEGSMLSADISGFTALSEKLAGKGKAGAEEITELVNKCFTALIDAAYEYGGEVLKFGGDALLILFRGDDHEFRSVDAGLAMQRALYTSAAAKRSHLTMTVGVADGPFDVFVVGSAYRELLITGPRASEVIRLEGDAAKGDTLVSETIAKALPSSMLVRQEAGGRVVTGFTGVEPLGPSERDLAEVDVSSFVPPSVRDQLAAFSGLGGEHRLVTVGFLMVGDVEAILAERGHSGVAEELHRLVDATVAACDAFGVTVLHTDIAPDGVKFVLCAGAPVNTGDSPDAMLSAALAIAAIESPFVLRQGVQTGRVFAGFLGSAHRRTYTLMGDPVNTAARMLGKANDRDVVAVDTVVRVSRTVFATEAIEPFHVKGKSEAIVAHKVLHASDSVRHASSGTQLVGRARELGVLSNAVDRLGRVVVLTGPAGAGKSRLLDEALRAVTAVPVFQTACTPYGAASPYGVFRPLFRAGLGVAVDADPAEVGDRLTRVVNDRAPQLLPMLPLLAIPYGAEVDPTPEAAAVDPQYRRARIHEVVLAFLDAIIDGPVILVIEDLHWIDDASGELANHLMSAVEQRSWTGILSRRPTGAWEPPPPSDLVRHIGVEPLTASDIREIAIAASAQPLSDGDLDVVVERSGGNPLFATELARTLGHDSRVGAIPASIEELITTRIDALPPAQRRLVRVASVFGQEFELPAVDAVTPEYAALGPELDEIVENLRGGRYRFRHAMYRDAAYEGLPFRQREELHGRVAEYLSATIPDLDDQAALLSMHYAAARRHREAYEFATVAAEAAAAAYSHRAAFELYERALLASRHCRHVDARRRSELLVQLGRSLEFAGELDRADAAYARAGKLTHEPDVQLDSLRRRARVRQKQNRMSAAARFLGRATRVADSLGDDASAQRRRAEIHLNLSGIRMDQGRLEEARVEAHTALDFALQAGDDPLRIHAYGAIVGATTDWEEAERYVELGLGPNAPADAYEARSILAINLGMAAYFAGRWTQAVELYETGGRAAQAMGNVTAGALAAMNAAEILVDQGRYEVALDALADVRRVLAAAGYRAALLYSDLLRATAMVRLGELRDGRDLLDHCADGFRSGSMLLYALETQLRIAECQIRSRDRAVTETARLAIEAASEVARHEVIRARALRMLGAWALVRGDRQSAEAHLLDAITICRAQALRYELALALVPLASVAEDPEPMLAEARELFDELGVTVIGRPSIATSWLPGRATDRCD